MVENKSRELLQQLHDEINNLETVDEKGAELLQDLDGDIRALLLRSKGQVEQVHPSIIRRFDRAISYFEVSHPDLTDLISKVSNALSNAGV